MHLAKHGKQQTLNIPIQTHIQIYILLQYVLPLKMFNRLNNVFFAMVLVEFFFENPMGTLSRFTLLYTFSGFCATYRCTLLHLHVEALHSRLHSPLHTTLHDNALSEGVVLLSFFSLNYRLLLQLLTAAVASCVCVWYVLVVLAFSPLFAP